MTGKPDWADESAKRIYGYLVSDSKGFALPMRRDIEAAEMAIASALRVAGKNNEEAAELRGRIKGLWEAADLIHHTNCELKFDEGSRKREWVNSGFVRSYDAVAARADDLERNA